MSSSLLYPSNNRLNDLIHDHPQDSKTYLSIMHAYWTARAYNSAKTIQALCYLDELLKTYNYPVVHFEKVVVHMDEEQKRKEASYHQYWHKQTLKEIHPRKIFGYAAALKT